MSRENNLKVIVFVGLSGSGKSTAVAHFTDKGFPKVYFGGVIHQAMKDAGIPLGEEIEREFRVKIREQEGPDFVVKRIIQQIHDLAGAGQHRIVADGLYTWDEYKLMKHEFPGELTFIAVVAPRKLRYGWLEHRPERPQTPEISMERDRNEIEKMQKGGPIAGADYFVVNNGSFDDFYQQLDVIADAIEF